ncbi:unnamed protein product [Sphenostylis stenocarpa]|uniref:Hydrophobic seed protein domain-containing protein n=1 Tax=Sphenostylis stenocarpa TaxID=92480 RepID=A0AA86VK72_9FABA|nr:unnamed protein product [Sphenostylis stenocarpa]
MGSKSVACVSFLLSLNLLFFSMVSSIAPAPLTPSPPPRECPEVGICIDVLNGLGGRLFGSKKRLLPLLGGLIEADAILCICDVLKSRILGIPILVQLVLQQILTMCGNNQTYICN